MSGEKKRYRWRHGPLLIEENLIINSKSSSSTTTTTRRIQEEKHTANTRRQWYKNEEKDDEEKEEEENEDIQLTSNETISEKIDRVLKKINAWTNETSTTTTTNQKNSDIIDEETSLKKIVKPFSNYPNIRQRSYEVQPNYDLIENSFRRRCSSSTYDDLPMIKTHRPYSMTFIDQPLLSNPKSSDEKIPKFHRQISFAPHRYSYQQQQPSIYSPHTNLTSLSSMYGSDFFYPSLHEQQPEYDNLTLIQNSSRQQYDPFPTIVVDCQRCSRSVDRSSLRDISCQVPSDEDELYQDIPMDQQKTSRSSPLFSSPRSSPTLPCQPPIADSLLAPYHFRRKHSLSSYISTHNRSKSVPSSSSSISSRKTHLPPSLCPLPTTSQSHLVPSTHAILRSIKTSIDAMKKRLKDIRRLSEVGHFHQMINE